MDTNGREENIASKQLGLGDPVTTIPDFLRVTGIALGSIPGVEAVAWCGSAAMGVADAHSDFDFYVYTHAPVSLESRRSVILERSQHSQLNNTFWELEDEWIDREGRRFNAMYRSCDFVLGEIAARLERYSADLGYSTAYCFSVANGFILHDPRQWLGTVQEQLRRPFPESLTRSIVVKNRPVLGGGMQSCYLAQMKAAIAREDLISLNHRAAVWISSYTDILFAVNRQYHPGEKRLVMYMQGLPELPEGALEDVPRLCALAGSLSSPIIEHVTGMLSRLDRWLEKNGR
ncbi:MAG: DUF4037 domain-containing protein [Verrucomicrobia bacterium]|nr:DUF4037 domain-containing protein [Verrucomicrobiota bacterium]